MDVEGGLTMELLLVYWLRVASRVTDNTQTWLPLQMQNEQPQNPKQLQLHPGILASLSPTSRFIDPHNNNDDTERNSRQPLRRKPSYEGMERRVNMPQRIWRNLMAPSYIDLPSGGNTSNTIVNASSAFNNAQNNNAPR